MKMSKRAETALRASIKHWKDDVLENNIEPDISNCPCCKLYFRLDRTCGACPISKGGCNCYPESVYGDYCITLGNGLEEERREAARKMLKFMEDLLP